MGLAFMPGEHELVAAVATTFERRRRVKEAAHSPCQALVARQGSILQKGPNRRLCAQDCEMEKTSRMVSPLAGLIGSTVCELNSVERPTIVNKAGREGIGRLPR